MGERFSMVVGRNTMQSCGLCRSDTHCNLRRYEAFMHTVETADIRFHQNAMPIRRNHQAVEGALSHASGTYGQAKQFPPRLMIIGEHACTHHNPSTPPAVPGGLLANCGDSIHKPPVTQDCTGKAMQCKLPESRLCCWH
jgi:hypothetical protein